MIRDYVNTLEYSCANMNATHTYSSFNKHPYGLIRCALTTGKRHTIKNGDADETDIGIRAECVRTSAAWKCHEEAQKCSRSVTMAHTH